MNLRPDFDVPTPCDADFGAMREVGPHARRCDRCATVVHDVGATSPADASALLSRARVDSVCVRAPARSPRARLALIAPLVISACSASSSNDPEIVGKVSVRPDDSSMVTDFEVGKIRVHAQKNSMATALPSSRGEESSSSSSSPRAWDVEKGSLRMHVIDRPGMLIDGNAPPPPPGQPLSPHPFLSGSCNNDVLGCADAGRILRDSKSTDEFISRLATAGFIVKPASP